MTVWLLVTDEFHWFSVLSHLSVGNGPGHEENWKKGAGNIYIQRERLERRNPYIYIYIYAVLVSCGPEARRGRNSASTMFDRGRVRPAAFRIPFNDNLPLDASTGGASFLLVMIIAMAPFLVGVINVLWPVVMRTWRQLWGNSVSEARRTITGRFHRSDPIYRCREGGVCDHSGILFHAALLYIARGGGGTELLSEAEWRNKPSVLFLFDPLKSDSHLLIGPNSFEAAGIFQSKVEGRVFCERERLHRYTVLRLPTSGTWMAVGDGIQVTYQRQREDKEKVGRVNHMLHLKAAGPSGLHRIENFVSQLLRHYVTALPTTANSTRFYFQMQLGGDGLRFTRSPIPSAKTFDTLFFPQKRDVLSLLDRFLRREGRFAVEGVPHKVGFFLYGPEGTGKTSFAAALAAYTSRHVISLCPSLFSTNQQLLDVFFGCQLECIGENEPFEFAYSDVIFLLDDVDPSDPLLRRRSTAASGERLKEVGKTLKCGAQGPQFGDATSISSLLNVLDGVVETPSRIAVMTTRDPSGIDPSFLRPGRFGYKIHMDRMRLPELLELLGLHYGTEENCATESNGFKKVRQLGQEEINKVRRCMALVAPDDFSISAAVAESMCFAASSLDVFLDLFSCSQHSGQEDAFKK
ncbi:hypothetical protein TcBrA4_0077280 [Trypanosoma cruzi]|nr:hypothetical protein TcBrA4_0077280 [Trypanosoma cruzi]